MALDAFDELVAAVANVAVEALVAVVAVDAFPVKAPTKVVAVTVCPEALIAPFAERTPPTVKLLVFKLLVYAKFDEICRKLGAFEAPRYMLVFD